MNMRQAVAEVEPTEPEGYFLMLDVRLASGKIESKNLFGLGAIVPSRESAIQTVSYLKEKNQPDERIRLVPIVGGNGQWDQAEILIDFESYRTIEIPQSDQYAANSRRIKGDAMPCIVCGKSVTNIKHMVHIIHGGNELLHREDEEKYRIACIEDPDLLSGDLYWYPIGADCLKRHPELRDYVIGQ